MKIKYQILFILSFITVMPAYGQTTDVNSQLIVQFVDDSFQIPENKSVIFSLYELKKVDLTLKKTLQKLNIKKIERIIPLNARRTTSGISKNGKEIKFHSVNNIYTITLSSDVSDAITRLKNNPLVLFAEKNFIQKPNSITPNDTQFPSQWNLHNNLDGGINAKDAWETTKGSSNTTIGILDSGVESWHNEIGDKLISIDQGSSDDVNSGWHSHGFSVAGIAAAVTDNSYGIAGIDWFAKIYSRRIDVKSVKTSSQKSRNSKYVCYMMAHNNLQIFKLSRPKT